MAPLKKLDQVRRAVRARDAQDVAIEGVPARAAVAILIEPRGDDLYLCFIHRAVDEKDLWSGHMGFPGGFRHEGDSDLLETARREVREEIGIDLERSAQLLGRLDEIQAVARGRSLPLVITPFLFVLREPIEPSPNEEVQSVLWIPLAFLEDPSSESTIEYRIEDQPMRLPAFIYEDRTIWGLTYRMLRNFLDLIDDRPAERSL